MITHMLTKDFTEDNDKIKNYECQKVQENNN